MAFAIAKRLDRTPQGREQIARVIGRPHLKLAGTYIDELAILGKAILLAPIEAGRFNAEAYGYATNPALRACGYSDASGDWCNDAVLFLKKE
jgi:hypothetical protein